MKVTIYYDDNGTILTSNTPKENIQGSIYPIEYDLPEDRILSCIDTSTIPHTVKTLPKPKTELEELKEYCTSITKALAMKDYNHDKSIEDLISTVGLLTNNMKALYTDIENLKKGAAANE